MAPLDLMPMARGFYAVDGWRAEVLWVPWRFLKAKHIYAQSGPGCGFRRTTLPVTTWSRFEIRSFRKMCAWAGTAFYCGTDRGRCAAS